MNVVCIVVELTCIISQFVLQIIDSLWRQIQKIPNLCITCSRSLHGHLQSIGDLFILCHAAKVW